jgi:hypothetical protein
MLPLAPATPRRPLLLCVFVTFTALMCGALLCAAALVPAPPVVLPLLAVVCIGCPMAAAWELPAAVAALRRTGVRALDPRSVEALRRQIDDLPETQHPLGL